MARCGCATDCLCILQDGDCTSVVGSGSVTAPYVVNVDISANAGNQVTCEPDGLFAPPPPTELPITVLDTDCIDLDGDGTAADPLTATPIISPDIGNTFECRPTGIFVPAVSQAPVDRRATILHSPGVLPTILPPVAINAESEMFVDYDFVEENVGLSVFPGGGGSFAVTTIELPVGAEGVYLIQAAHPGFSSAPANPLGDMIVRLRLWRNHVPGPATGEGIGQSAGVRFTTNTGFFNTPSLYVGRTLRLYDGDAISVSFVCQDFNGAFPGATLDVGPTYGLNGGITPPPAGRGLAFFQITKLGLP